MARNSALAASLRRRARSLRVPAPLVVVFFLGLAAFALAMVTGVHAIALFAPLFAVGTLIELPDLSTMRSLEELSNHRKAVRDAITKLNEQYVGQTFPNEARDEFAQYVDRDKTLTSHITELEERTKIVARISGTESNTESERSRGVFGHAPAQINKQRDADIWDLSTVRMNAGDPSEANQEIRDRAMRAVELTHFGHPGIERSVAQGHVARLLDTADTEDKQLARRILATGSPAYQRAFAKVLGGKPMISLTQEEQRALERAMSVGTGSAGGFAVPYLLDPTLIPISNFSVNPWRSIAAVETIVGTNEWRGVTTTGITAARAAEATEASDNSVTLAQPTLTTTRVQAFVPVSIELTQDLPALQAQIAQILADAKDDEEATAFATGNGTTPNPQGVITGATNTVNSAGAAAFVIADLYALEQALPPRFRPRAKMVMNRFVANKIRQFDTAGGAGLWTPLPAPLTVGLQNNPTRGANQGSYGREVIGYPAFEASAMVAALTTGSKLIVMGDFGYYKIVDRVGMDIEIIPHLFGAANRFPTGQRGIYAIWRNYGKVLDAAAFRVLITI